LKAVPALSPPDCLTVPAVAIAAPFWTAMANHLVSHPRGEVEERAPTLARIQASGGVGELLCVEQQPSSSDASASLRRNAFQIDRVEIQGDRTEGDRTQGDRTDRVEIQGDRTEGDRTQGDRTEGDRTQGDRTDRVEIQGDRTEGDRTQGDRTEGDRAEDRRGLVPSVRDEDGTIDRLTLGASGRGTQRCELAQSAAAGDGALQAPSAGADAGAKRVVARELVMGSSDPHGLRLEDDRAPACAKRPAFAIAAHLPAEAKELATSLTTACHSSEPGGDAERLGVGADVDAEATTIVASGAAGRAGVSQAAEASRYMAR
jgi:hypothetical protein